MFRNLLAFLFLLLTSPVYAGWTATYSWPNCANPDAATYTITNDAGWDKVKKLDGTYTKFCVTPGNYKAAGDINISNSCTATKPCMITWYKAGSPYSTSIKQATADRATIRSIKWNEKSHWHVRGIRVNDGNHESANPGPIQIINNSDNIVLDGVLAEAGQKNNILITRGSDDVVIQNSVIRESNKKLADTHCIYITPGEIGLADKYQNVLNLKIVHNEIYDCNGDAIQIQNSVDSAGNQPKEFGIQGALIADNDMYTYGYRANCSTGALEPGTGNCTCGENAVDFKTASASASAPVIFTENRMWGYRAEHEILSGACPNSNNHKTPGFAVNIQSNEGGSGNVDLTKNLFFDSANGLYTEVGAANIKVNKNIFYKVATQANSVKLNGVIRTGAKNFTITDNIVVDSDVYLKTDPGVAQISNNHFINAGDWAKSSGYDLASGSNVGNNFFYNTQAYDGVRGAGNDVIYKNASYSGFTDLCFTRKIHTAPEQYCIPYANDGTSGEMAPPATPTGLVIDVVR